MLPTKFKTTPLRSVVLLWHVVNCEDASNDADRTVEELINELDANGGYLTKGVLESGLYCCNMEHEKGRFWHPLGWSFDRFLQDLLNPKLEFDKYYNIIREKKYAPEAQTQTKNA